MANIMADVHVKVDKKIKNESEEVLKKIGISLSDLVNMTLRRVVYERRIPFETKIVEEELPENMRIKTKEELIEYLEKNFDKNEGKSYDADEIKEILAKEKLREKI